MRKPDGTVQDDATDREIRLHRLTELFAPHVRDLVGEEARKRTLFLPMGRVETVALQMPAMSDMTVRSIVERALAGEAKLIVREWTLLLTEHAGDDGRTLRLSSLDDAMLPPFDEELGRIFRECCDRRMAGQKLTRGILSRVRASLPADEPLPADALAVFASRGIAVVP